MKKSKKKKDRIRSWEMAGFTVAMFGIVLFASEAESFTVKLLGALIGIILIGIGVVIYNLPKIVNCLAKKESALSSGHSDKATAKNITNGILSESGKNVKCL